MSAILVAIAADGESQSDPSVKQLATCQSVHAMAYNAHGEMLLNESTGYFGLGAWEAVAELAQKQCIAAIANTGEDETMENADVEAEPWLRQALEEKVRDANAWREST